MPRGERSVRFGIKTIDDQEYDLPGFIRAEVLTGGGYQVIDGLDNIKIITIADNDASPVNNLMSIAAIDQFGVPEGVSANFQLIATSENVRQRYHGEYCH